MSTIWTCDACGVAVTHAFPRLLIVAVRYTAERELYRVGLCVRCADDAERELNAALAPILARKAA